MKTVIGLQFICAERKKKRHSKDGVEMPALSGLFAKSDAAFTNNPDAHVECNMPIGLTPLKMHSKNSHGTAGPGFEACNRLANDEVYCT